MGLLRSCATVAHGFLFTFFLQPDTSIETRISHEDFLWGNYWANPSGLGNIFYRNSLLFLEGGRPVVFIEEGGHGIGNLSELLEDVPSGDISFNGIEFFKFHGDDGIIYRLVMQGEVQQSQPLVTTGM